MKVSLLLFGNLLPDVVLLKGRSRRVWSDRLRTGRRRHICTRAGLFLGSVVRYFFVELEQFPHSPWSSDGSAEACRRARYLLGGA